MAYEQKDGDFSLFANDKGDNPKRPDMTGTALIGGVKYKVSAWTREGRNGGKKFLSGRIERAQQQYAPAAPPVDDPNHPREPARANVPRETNTEMPF